MSDKPGAKGRARGPCASCPYRQNVPSGVWAANEYEKLPEYDRDMGEQPIAAFYCHQQDGAVCAGWLGHRDPYDMLAVRLGVSTGHLDVSCLDYQTDVPLFASGAEAAAHGLRDIKHPGKAAEAVMRKITTKKGINDGTSGSR